MAAATDYWSKGEAGDPEAAGVMPGDDPVGGAVGAERHAAVQIQCEAVLDAH
jgi:hypothetical protein